MTPLEQAVEAVKNGMAYSAAATEYHVSFSRVRDVCKKRGIKSARSGFKQYTKKDDNYIRKHYEERGYCSICGRRIEEDKEVIEMRPTNNGNMRAWDYCPSCWDDMCALRGPIRMCRMYRELHSE